MTKENLYQEIACQQVLMKDSSVFSLQSSIFPQSTARNLTPEILMNHYFAYLSRSTFSIIRTFSDSKGVEFRVLGGKIAPLIRFLPPIIGDSEVIIKICGGVLVQKEHQQSGELRFEITEMPNGVKVSLQLSGYYPIILGSSEPPVIRRWLYSLTQAPIHKLYTIRFLSLLYQELTRTKVRFRVVPVQVQQGQII